MAIIAPRIPGLTDWRPLARGGFAVVWEARQESLDRLVAVKVDQRRLDTEPERLRFLREAGAAGRMSAHPGIVTVHDAGILEDDRPYLVMELCPGGSLTTYLTPETRPSEQRVCEIGVRIADALAATHARGVLHRDVKPANILIDAYDQAGLADFGLAVVPGPDTAAEATFEALTPAYTPPEILRRRPASAKGDVYSLAATLYALLAGRPPRWPATGSPSLSEVLELQQQPVPQLPDVSPALNEVLLTALSSSPEDRPDAATFRDQLAGVGPTPPAPDPVDDVAARAETGPSRGATRRRRGLLVGALLALVLVIVMVSAIGLAGRGDAPAAITTPSGAASTPANLSPTPTPTPSVTPSQTFTSPTPDAVPSGFVDCSSQDGTAQYCASTPECWGGLVSVQDTPALGTPRSCERMHVYQTYAAGPVGFDVRRQSQLEKDPAVQDTCSPKVLRSMLSGTDREITWELYALPPQEADGSDRFFRCIFGRGDRNTPITLRRPSS